MNHDAYVPASDIRGCLRKLSKANTDQVSKVVFQTNRDRCHAILQKLPEHLRILVPSSETKEDRENAKRFYHRAFCDFVRDVRRAGHVPMVFISIDCQLFSAEDWMFEPKAHRGEDWTGATYDHVFQHLSKKAFLCSGLMI